MQQGSYRDDFCVVFNVLELPNLHCKEPGANNVVEKVRLALQSGILHGPVDDWGRGNLYPGEYSSVDRLHVLLPFSIVFRVLRRSPIRCERTRRFPLLCSKLKVWLARDEGKQIRVHGIGVSRAHPVREAFVDLESRLFQELDREWR